MHKRENETKEGGRKWGKKREEMGLGSWKGGEERGDGAATRWGERRVKRERELREKWKKWVGSWVLRVYLGYWA